MTVSPGRQRELLQQHLIDKSPDTRRLYLASLASLQRWADRDELDLAQLKTPDLERFLSEEGRRYSRATVQIRRAALRAFYRALEDAGILERSPADRLRLASIDHLAAAGPVEYLAEETVSHLREHALKLGPVSSLAICMLHETPASLRRIAGLAATDFARDRDGEAFAMLGQSRRSQAPWPISQQILDAVEALKSEHHRLISPRTKNPNIPMVKTAVEETRLAAGVDAPKLVEALKNVHRRRQRELCASVPTRADRLPPLPARAAQGPRPVQAALGQSSVHAAVEIPNLRKGRRSHMDETGVAQFGWRPS